MRTALFLLMLNAAPFAQGREWSDAAGKFEGEFEACDVVVRLPNGEEVTIPFSDLSNNDRAFVLDELKRIGRDGGAAVLPEIAKTLEKNIATLQQQIAGQAPSGEIKKTLDAIRTADPAFKRLEPIVKKFLDSGKPAAVLAGLTILGEFKIADVWLIEKLLTLEKEYGRALPIQIITEYQPYRTQYWFFSADEYATLINDTMRPYRRIIGLLAGLVDRDPRVKMLFDERIASVQSAPEPDTRVIAAVGLSGAKPMADKLVPILTNAMKNDASTIVQVAAGFSLGGYDGNANGVVQSLIEKLEQSNVNEFYLSALIEGGGDSPLLRKVIKRMFEAYRSTDDSSHNLIPHACAVLARNGQDNSWAIVDLTDCCTVAFGRTDQGSFETLRGALLTIGRTDPRVLKFFEKQSRDAPDWARVACDTAAKQVAANIRAGK